MLLRSPRLHEPTPVRAGAAPSRASAALTALALAPAIPARRAAVFPSTWRFASGRTGIIAAHGMNSSNSELASEVGVEILEQGGNAVDAAVATGFALEVTHPSAGNIGGGGFMVIRMADGRTAALDYREVAPLAATRDMYLDSTGKLTDKSLIGALASGVPGSVAGMAEALRRYGTMSLHDVMQPAIRLARDGFVADSIVAEEQRDGWIITKADLARYTPKWRDPSRSSHRGYAIIAMPPSSSGGITTAETLNILETYDSLPPFGTAEYEHLVAEAFRRAFIDRNTQLGDPDFVSVPVAKLISKQYARTLARNIDASHSSRTPTFANAGPEPIHTTHYSVADAQGNAVATTTTLNSGYGSGVYIRGAGFFMNNEMDDFAAQPGKPNQFGLVQGEADAIQPGKRMLSAMSPTIVLDPRGQLLLVVGAAGGPTIITATAQVILNVIDNRMSPGDAMAAPRIHQQAWPDSIRFERGGLTQAVMDSLTAMGHRLSPARSIANANAVMRVRGGYEGVVEPRSTGGAVGY